MKGRHITVMGVGGVILQNVFTNFITLQPEL